MKYICEIIILVIVFNTAIPAQKNIEVVVKENQTIRSIALQYLGDSNLWEDILKANNLSSPADIKQGIKLKIPIESIKENQEALNSAITAINEASKAGAKLFAENIINQATILYNKALEERKAGRRKESTKLANKAKEEADKAIIESQNKSNTSGTALLSFKKGDVEKKEPAELIWNEAELYAKLFEHYRARTLSNSYAEISFKDLSKIRLYENSQAVIQSSRVNLLKNQKKASVNLEKGEAYALLLGNGKKKDFNFNIPGIDTKINSKLFWVQKASKDTKIANYNGEIAVTARDSMVVIKENEGSVVPDDGVPSEPKTLLPSPELIQPEFEATFFVSNINFRWSEISGAANYSFVVSGDREFDTVVETKKSLNEPEYSVDNLSAGIYYWRVAAVDETGFPGPFSQNGFFIVREDKTKPYLTVKTPKDSLVTKESTLKVSGSTETEVDLFINDKSVKVDSSGFYESVVSLKDGFNSINIKAVDLGENETAITKDVYFESDPNVEISLSSKNNFIEQNKIVSAGNSVTVYGLTRSRSQINLLNTDGISLLKTFADNEGKFEFLISDFKSGDNFRIAAESPAGYNGEMEFSITIDSSEPDVIFKDFRSAYSKTPITISGKVVNTSSLSINGLEVELAEDNFSHQINLNNGENLVSIRAISSLGIEKKYDRNILFDNDPPELIKSNITKETADKFIIVKVKVSTEDKSELKRTAVIEYILDGQVRQSYIRLNSGANIYEGSIQIPRSQKNNYRLLSIKLEDYLNNSKIYKF